MIVVMLAFFCAGTWLAAVARNVIWAVEFQLDADERGRPKDLLDRRRAHPRMHRGSWNAQRTRPALRRVVPQGRRIWIPNSAPEPQFSRVADTLPRRPPKRRPG